MDWLALWQPIDPPTDPNNINTVLAWLVPILFAAIAWLEVDGRRQDRERHADKDKVIARLEKTVDDQTAAIRETTAASREMAAALKEQTSAIRALQDRIEDGAPRRRAT